MKSKQLLFVSTIFTVIATAIPASAADKSWDGGTDGTGRSWSFAGSWNDDTAIAAGDNLFIGSGTLNGSQTILYSTRTYMALSSVSSAAYTVAPRSVTFDNSPAKVKNRLKNRFCAASLVGGSPGRIMR